MKKPLILPDSPHLKDQTGDGRLHAPSAARNQEPIAEVLAQILPARGDVLELASGTGQHICAFAARWPDLTWQPSDVEDERLDSIRAWGREAELANLREAILLDAVGGWDALGKTYDFIYVVNLLHLISEDQAAAVLSGMAGGLNPGGQVMIYGPFSDNGAFRSEGDATFDASLRSQDPEIGYKDSQWVLSRLKVAGLKDLSERQMPASNLILHATVRSEAQ